MLSLETDGLDAGYSLDDGGFSVGDMTDGADVYGGLAGYNLRGKGS